MHAMQAMEEEQEEQPMPTELLITPETRRLDVELRPPGAGGGGPRGEVAVDLRLAITECHTWLGIGGRTGRVRRPKRLSRKISLTLDGNSSSGGGGDDDCRRRLGRAIKNSLRKEEEYRRLSPAHWDGAVPWGVERALILAVQRAGAAAGGGGTCEARLDISVRFEFVYSEPEALLRACVENSGGGDPAAWRSGNGDGDGDDDDAPACTICLKGMERDADEVTDMPGCTHGFHTWCIVAWFHKASTCPVCRRDQLQYLPPDYRDLHDRMMMTFDPDSLPDYL